MSDPSSYGKNGLARKKWPATALLIASLLVGSLAFTSTMPVRQASGDLVPTSIFIDMQSVAVGEGVQVTIRGSLIDETLYPNPLLANKTIHFELNGDPLVSVGSVVTTNEFGDFGPPFPTFDAPSEVGYWNLTAYFDGDLVYLPSSASTIFATADSGAMYFEVTDGQSDYFDVDVPLTNFNFTAALQFESVQTDWFSFHGEPIEILVSQCTAPEPDGRFLPLSFDAADNNNNICLEIFPGPLTRFDDNPGIWVNISHAGMESLPEGYSEDNIDLFHYNTMTDEIAEITASRNVDTQEISGRALDVGKFIVGIGLHGEASEGAIRQHVFIGDDQQVMLRNVTDMSNTTASIVSISPDEITLDEPVTIKLNYTNGNLDVSSIDILSVQINSTSSTPDFVTIAFTEDSANSGIFTGSLTLTTGPTSGSSLHANDTDTLTFVIPSKDSTDGRFKAILDGVAEAGFVELSDFEMTGEELNDLIVNEGFVPVVGLVNMTLVDANLDSFDGQIHVTMSYANALIGPVNASALKIYHRTPGSGWDTTPPVAVIDTTNLLVSATFDTTQPGLFALAFPSGTPGGAGGGLGKPGVGVVLDFLVPFAPTPPPDSPAPSDGGGSSGGSTSRSSTVVPLSDQSATVTTQISGGEDSKAVITTTSGSSLEISFESVTSNFGAVTVKETSSLEAYQELFDSFSEENNRATISIRLSNTTNDKSEYTTIGNIFDIQISPSLEYSGHIRITMPYNESLTKVLGQDESSIRLLHYDVAVGWEDNTVFIDTVNNNITAVVTSLSPFVAAIAIDGTFDGAYFLLNPLDKVSVSHATLLLPGAAIDVGSEPSAASLTNSVAKKGGQISISAAIKNLQRNDQEFVFLVQVLDEQDYVQSISWQTGTLERGQLIEPFVSWIPEEVGRYTIKLFVWNSIGAIGPPLALSDVTIKNIQVIE